MRRSIIAIIAIACLQASYIAYTHFEILRDQVRAATGFVTEPVVVRPKVADLRAVDEPTYFAVFGELDEAEDEDYAEPHDASISAASAPTKKRVRRGMKRGFHVNPVKFKDTIITVARSEPYRFETYSQPKAVKANSVVQPRTNDAVDTEKKNPLRRTLPVVKKPYVWIKSLGSSLK